MGCSSSKENVIVTKADLRAMSTAMVTVKTWNHMVRWRRSFLKLDPRTQVANFFYPGDISGPCGAVFMSGPPACHDRDAADGSKIPTLERSMISSAPTRLDPTAIEVAPAASPSRDISVNVKGASGSVTATGRGAETLTSAPAIAPQSTQMATPRSALELGPVLSTNSLNVLGKFHTDFGPDCPFGSPAHLALFPSRYFSVWRPTSKDALRLMMVGAGTGKGLNIKGKSAKGGVLSGLVPFLQITDDADKAKCTQPSECHRMRIYFQSGEARREVIDQLMPVARAHAVAIAEKHAANAMQKALADAAAAEAAGEAPQPPPPSPSTSASAAPSDEELRERIELLDGYAPTRFGVELPSTWVWVGMIEPQDISATGEWATGRGSEPMFMDLNYKSLHYQPSEPSRAQPRTVVYQHDGARAMNPRGLVMAYEELDGVLPVVSDMDAFVLGAKGVEYQPMPVEQLELLEWMVEKTANVLRDAKAQVERREKPTPWMRAWVHEIKRDAEERDKDAQHLQPSDPMGFGDATSCKIFDAACGWTSHVGAVRHGAECFNLLCPQDLDEEYLVTWDGFNDDAGHRGAKFRYLSERELRSFLLERIDDGYCFPLNPKWVLCDKGWYDVWWKLNQANNGDGLEPWFPRASRLRARIEELHEIYRGGYPLQERTTEPGACHQMIRAETELDLFFTERKKKRRSALADTLEASGRIMLDGVAAVGKTGRVVMDSSVKLSVDVANAGVGMGMQAVDSAGNVASAGAKTAALAADKAVDVAHAAADAAAAVAAPVSTAAVDAANAAKHAASAAVDKSSELAREGAAIAVDAAAAAKNKAEETAATAKQKAEDVRKAAAARFKRLNARAMAARAFGFGRKSVSSATAGHGTLKVQLLSARNLAAADKSGTSDPYVKLTILGVTHKSTVAKKSLNPTWREQTFEWTGVKSSMSLLELAVFDHDDGFLDADDRLGMATVHLAEKGVYNELTCELEAALNTRGTVQLRAWWTATADERIANGTGEEGMASPNQVHIDHEESEMPAVAEAPALSGSLALKFASKLAARQAAAAEVPPPADVPPPAVVEAPALSGGLALKFASKLAERQATAALAKAE